eukprot:1195638-Prorocentrum_minimum.AAC.10
MQRVLACMSHLHGHYHVPSFLSNSYRPSVIMGFGLLRQQFSQLSTARHCYTFTVLLVVACLLKKYSSRRHRLPWSAARAHAPPAPPKTPSSMNSGSMYCTWRPAERAGATASASPASSSRACTASFKS